MNPLFQYDPKNWTFFYTWLKELNLFLHESNNWTPLKYSKNWTCFWNVTQRIEPFFLECDSKNWTFFFWMWPKELNFFFAFFFLKKKTQRIELFLEYDPKNWTLRKKKELDSKKWTLFFFDVAQRIDPFFYMTQRLDNSFFYDLQELNSFLKIWLKQLVLFRMTQRVEPFIFKKYMTQWIEPCVKKRFKEFNHFFIWHKELNFFLQHDTKNWTLLNSKNWTLFWNVTQRIEPFFLSVTQRIEPHFSTKIRKELTLIFLQ